MALFAPAIWRSTSTSDAAAATRRRPTPPQARLTPLGAKIVGELGVAGVKAAMDASGCCGGPVRSPLLPLDAQQIAVVDELLRSAELVDGVVSSADAASPHLARLGAQSRGRPAARRAEARALLRRRAARLGFTVREEPFEYSAFAGAWATPVGRRCCSPLCRDRLCVGARAVGGRRRAIGGRSSSAWRCARDGSARRGVLDFR